VDWEDPLLYDLVLNTDRIDVKEGARLIQDTLRNERFQPTPESRAELRDLSLAAQAKAALVAQPHTRPLHLVVTVRHGRLVMSGTVDREDLRNAAEEIVAKVPGVTEVLNDIAVVVPPRARAGV